ncbi:hypothetical protein GCM10011488_60040 [Steroidobacter agaridevorans]|nr:hypothetical protein GCM10011488_60040 [Steroidobacter agaridevorans]
MAGLIDMREQSDEDLFVYMSFIDNASDRPVAEAAFAEVHRRYAAELYSRCRDLCRRLGQPTSLAEDLVSLTLTRALDRAETYRGPGTSARTMAWLCKIARNALIDAHRNPHRPSSIGSGSDSDLGAEIYSAQDFASLYHQFESPLATREHWTRVAAAFQELDERCQRVLLETLLQRSKSPGQSYMYRGTAALLAERLGITPENLRRIRYKGMKAISEKLQQCMPSKGAKHGTAR